MNTLSTITKGREPKPRRIVVYGVQGVGKSTFASEAPKPVFIPTEDGLGNIDCFKFPLCTKYEQVTTALRDLNDAGHEFETVVIDSVDWLEKAILEEVCMSKGVECIEDIPYAKGYLQALPYWHEILQLLDTLRDERGMATILLAHAKVERYENPETDPYDRFVPRLNKHACARVLEWPDEVFFACFETFTKSIDAGFNRTRTQGIGTGKRILRTTERPSHVAKNRLSLPNEIPLKWEEYSKYFPIYKGDE